MRISLPILFFLFHILLSGQTYSFQQVKDSSYALIESQIGKEFSQYFELHPKSMNIAYLNWRGKKKSKWINPNQTFNTKGLEEVSLFLEFKHPDLPSTEIDISFCVSFDENLSSQDTFDLNRIPVFIREGRSCDWLTALDRQEIKDTLGFEKEVKRILTSTVYDKFSSEYYFEVRSIFDSKDGYYYYENYWINVVSGRIEKHFFSKSYVCSML